jgi:DNA-binding CsgD family transcriptional regulator
MPHLILILNDDLVRALHELSEWEQQPEIEIAADLLRLALTRALPERELRAHIARLTDREREVAGLLRKGLTRHQIGDQLHLAPETVKTHLRNIRRKFGLQSVAEIVEILEKAPPGLLVGISVPAHAASPRK